MENPPLLDFDNMLASSAVARYEYNPNLQSSDDLPTVEIIADGDGDQQACAPTEHEIKLKHCRQLMTLIGDRLTDDTDLNVINNVETILSKTLMYLEESVQPTTASHHDDHDDDTVSEEFEIENLVEHEMIKDDDFEGVDDDDADPSQYIISCNDIKNEVFDDIDDQEEISLDDNDDGRTKIVVINV